MRHILLYILVFVSISIWGTEPIKIGVITDTHYLSEKLTGDGSALKAYVSATGRNIQDSPAILDKVLADYLQSDIQVLLICGDMTKDGEKQSHIDFVEKLKPLQNKGVRVFVIPGNHDINVPTSLEFRGDKTFSTPNITPKEFADIYADCGYKSALKKDDASLSYVSVLDGSTWLLAIDAARYKDYTTRSITGGRILPETEKWIVEILDEARAKNTRVIGMMHWGLTEHIIYQSMFFKDYLVDEWERFAALFADKGMKAIFTGHFHSNDISVFTSEAGNKIYDIETGTLTSYPFSYRFVNLYPDKMDIKTRHIVSIPDSPDLAEASKKQMQEIAKKLASQKLKGMGYGLSPDILPLFEDVLSQIFVLHIYGDEKPDDNLKASIASLAEVMDGAIDLDDIQLDFPPADNNVEIIF